MLSKLKKATNNQIKDSINKNTISLKNINKTLNKLSKTRREKSLTNTIRNENGKITTTTNIQRIIRNLANFDPNKFENLQETYNFLYTYDLLKLN